MAVSKQELAIHAASRYACRAVGAFAEHIPAKHPIVSDDEHMPEAMYEGHAGEEMYEVPEGEYPSGPEEWDEEGQWDNEWGDDWYDPYYDDFQEGAKKVKAGTEGDLSDEAQATMGLIFNQVSWYWGSEFVTKLIFVQFALLM